METFIIAEAGVNHNGNIYLAKKLVDIAKNSGANAIKFQTFKAKNLVTKNSKTANYQQKNADETSQYNMLKKLELSFDEFIELKNYCDKKNIIFLSTPFDDESIDFLDNLGLEIFKIPSGEITNIPYLRKIAKLNKKIILSTGMATLDEIEIALDNLLKFTKKENITLLHANTEYPTPFEDVNIKAMLTIKNTFNIDVGYSDHTPGIEASILAVSLGAKVIEKHFTIDKNLKGPDHKASLDPIELKKMVKAIRNIEKAFGDGIKKPSKSELKNIEIVRKKIVAKKNIKKGEIFTEENLTTKRTQKGISAIYWDSVIGKIAKKDYNIDDNI